MQHRQIRVKRATHFRPIGYRATHPQHAGATNWELLAVIGCYRRKNPDGKSANSTKTPRRGLEIVQKRRLHACDAPPGELKFQLDENASPRTRNSPKTATTCLRRPTRRIKIPINYPKTNPRLDWTAHGDGMHLNELGSRRAAKCLYHLLAEFKQLPTSEMPPSRSDSGQEDHAAIELARSLGSEQKLADGHRRAGILLVKLGKIDEAFANFTEALRLNPSDHVAHFELGIILTQKKRLAEAIAHYEDAVRIKPDYAEAHYNLSDALGSQGRDREAVYHL